MGTRTAALVSWELAPAGEECAASLTIVLQRAGVLGSRAAGARRPLVAVAAAGGDARPARGGRRRQRRGAGGRAARERGRPGRMILRVEPLTTTRRLRGPFDYRAPAGDGSIGVGSLLRIPFGAQKLLGVVVDVAETSEVPDERLASPLSVLGDRVPAELVSLAVWMAREYCSTFARALDAGAAAGRRARAAAAGAARAARPRAGGGRAADRSSARTAFRVAGSGSGAGRPRRPATAGGPRAGGAGETGGAAGAAGTAGRRGRRGGARADARAGGGAGGDRRRRPAVRSCCTASPARARPRSTCARRQTRSRVAAASSCWCRRSRWRRRL